MLEHFLKSINLLFNIIAVWVKTDDENSNNIRFLLQQNVRLDRMFKFETKQVLNKTKTIKICLTISTIQYFQPILKIEW